MTDELPDKLPVPAIDPTDPDFDAYYDALLPFLHEFESESDRASVILGAARLDVALEQLLQRALLPPVDNSTDELLGNDRPLGTFSARISAAYRLGLIDRPFRDALDCIRRIRNAFAHQLDSCSLVTGPQADRVRYLLKLHEHSDSWKGFHAVSRYRVPEGLAGDFRVLVAGMILRLEGPPLAVAAPDMRRAITLVP